MLYLIIKKKAFCAKKPVSRDSADEIFEEYEVKDEFVCWSFVEGCWGRTQEQTY